MVHGWQAPAGKSCNMHPLCIPCPQHTCADAAAGGGKAQQHMARQRLQRAQDGHYTVGLHKQPLQLAAGEAGDKRHKRVGLLRSHGWAAKGRSWLLRGSMACRMWQPRGAASSGKQRQGRGKGAGHAAGCSVRDRWTCGSRTGLTEPAWGCWGLGVRAPADKLDLLGAGQRSRAMPSAHDIHQGLFDALALAQGPRPAGMSGHFTSSRRTPTIDTERHPSPTNVPAPSHALSGPGPRPDPAETCCYAPLGPPRRLANLL